MKFVTAQDRKTAPVRHDPSLAKEMILEPGALEGIDGLSRIVLKPGTVIKEHSHDLGSEIFYCLRGNADMTVSGNSLTLRTGDCLVVEPGEGHSFDRIAEETELVYFFLFSPSS